MPLELSAEEEELTAPKPEIRFGYDNFAIDYNKNNYVIHKYNELTKIEFQISLLPKGVGLHSICQSEDDELSEYDVDMFRPNDRSIDDQDDDNDNEALGTITLIVGNRENKHPRFLDTYLILSSDLCIICGCCHVNKV